jgi:hypothetical protein
VQAGGRCGDEAQRSALFQTGIAGQPLLSTRSSVQLLPAQGGVRCGFEPGRRGSPGEAPPLPPRTRGGWGASSSWACLAWALCVSFVP